MQRILSDHDVQGQVSRLVTTPSAKADGFIKRPVALTTASVATHEASLYVRAARPRPGLRTVSSGQSLSPSTRWRRSGCFTTLRYNFYGRPSAFQPREVVFERAGLALGPVAIEAARTRQAYCGPLYRDKRLNQLLLRLPWIESRAGTVGPGGPTSYTPTSSKQAVPRRF